MTQEGVLRGLELRSLVTADGAFELSLQETEVVEPGPDQVVVRMEAAPIHPSDMALLLGPVDLKSLAAQGEADRPVTTGRIVESRVAMMAARHGLSLPIGNEGAGTVIKAGDNVKTLLGKTVAAAGGAMYTQYRLLDAANVMPVPDGISASDAAAAFVNPMTALAIAETARAEGYRGLIHTAAASTLGQMLVRICLADDFPLINVVRSEAQAELLRGIGAKYIVDSSLPGFEEKLADAIVETGIMVAFDAVGGGTMVGQLLAAMERALARREGEYSRYGSATHKQVYVYGGLDHRPMQFDRGPVGMFWGINSFMLGPFLEKAGVNARERLTARVAAELQTTFAIRYIAEKSLSEVLAPDTLRSIARRATGEKYLINPSKGL